MLADDMNTSSSSFANGRFTFLSTATNKIPATQGQVSCWVNGIPNPVDVLDLYGVYNEECHRFIDGISSFVLYDAERSRVVAARDFFGVYPLFYAEIDNNLLFSFSIRALIDSKRFTPKVNPLMIVDYLNWNSCNKPINNQTFYQNIYCLLPGHILIHEKGHTTIKPYGQLNLDKYASLTDKEYIRHFRDFFVRSVQKTVAPYNNVATHLSGGLDSSSVCSVAQSLSSKPVHSFYIHTDTPTAQEKEYVEAVLKKWAHKGRPIVHQHTQPNKNVYTDIVKTTSQLGQPSQLLLPVSTFLPIIERAQQKGCDILLSGHGGDQVLGYGFEYLDDLFQKQDWKTLKTAIEYYVNKRTLRSLNTKKLVKNTDEKRRAYAMYFFARKLKRSKNTIQWKQALGALFTQFNCEITDVFNWIYTRQKQTKEAPLPSLKKWIREDWDSTHATATVSELDSMQLISGVPSTLQKEQIDFLYSRLGLHYNEEIAQLHACYSLKTAHPFLDKELLELTVNTPSRLRFGTGLGRNVLREALKEYLPKKIINRVDKGEFSEYAHNAFITLYHEFAKQSSPHHPVWAIVDKKTFDDAIGIIGPATFDWTLS